ncbi:hypothetical protein C8J57DRAFT_1259086 [Mycena rebaudengoi]|nr:hypothetical protein C8J57DRAFT_1259086 [Mycena rebaudengoi]
MTLSFMPPFKKAIQDQLAHLNGCFPSPKKAIKHVAAIACSPVKSWPEKKQQPMDAGTDDPKENAAPTPKNSGSNGLMDVDLPAPSDHFFDIFHQGSTPELPTGAPAAFKLKGRLNRVHSTHSDDDEVSVLTFPAPCEPSLLESHNEDDNDQDDEVVPPELDELCALDSGAFPGDGYPRPAPPASFVEKMEVIGAKQALAVAPDVTSALAALTDIQLFLRGPSRGTSGGYKPPELSPWASTAI